MRRFLSALFLLIWGVFLITSYSLADTQDSLEQNALLTVSSGNESNIIYGSDPLPVNEAFQLSVAPINETTLNARWFITDGYYLYKDKISFASEDAFIANINYPDSKTKNDDFFGQVEVYEKIN